MTLGFILLCTALLLVACSGRVSQQSNDANGAVDLAAESMAVGSTVLELTMTAGSGTPINDATVDVKGHMTHAGVVPVLAEGVSDGQEGIFRVPFESTIKRRDQLPALFYGSLTPWYHAAVPIQWSSTSVSCQGSRLAVRAKRIL